MTLLQKIIEAIKESDHEVVSDLQAELNSAPNHDDDHYVHAFKCWLDDLQEMYDKAERVDDLENNLYHIDNLVCDAENSLSEIRGYTNV